MGDELNRWLRGMRPSTPADDGWTGTPEGERTLAEIHGRLARSTDERRRRRV